MFIPGSIFFSDVDIVGAIDIAIVMLFFDVIAIVTVVGIDIVAVIVIVIASSDVIVKTVVIVFDVVVVTCYRFTSLLFSIVVFIVFAIGQCAA